MRKGVMCIAVVVLANISLAVVAYIAITGPAGPPYEDPNPDSDLKIVALGDSYMSGEGAGEYFEGTDEPGENTCRRAPSAYAYQVALEVNASLIFPACSGARSYHVVNHDSPDDLELPEGRRQIEVLEEHSDADVVLLSIGGNDAEFGDIGRGCSLRGDCRRDADYWLRNLEQTVFPRVRAVFEEVRSVVPQAEVFVATYPDPLGPDGCAWLPISDAERRFLKEAFIPRLNEIIRFAASATRVRLIDFEETFAGSRICEVGIEDAAANVFRPSRTLGAEIDIAAWTHNSFHPNELGHRLLTETVVKHLDQFKEGSLPPLSDPPPRGIPPPPHVPDEIGPPIGPYEFPQGSPCEGTVIARILPLVAAENLDTTQVEVIDAEPGSLVCYREYKGRWRSQAVPETGVVELTLDTGRVGIGSLNEVLYRSLEGEWVKLVIRRLDVTVEVSGGIDWRWIFAAAGAGLVVLVGNVFAVLKCLSQRQVTV